MILGWQIFWFSLKQVFGNFFSVVKISTPMLFMSVILFIELQMDISGDGRILVGAAFAAFYIFSALWTTVSLHRFLLISEHPVGLFPVTEIYYWL